MMHNHAAQGLASLGRGPDTELVHMTKGEVAGLQSLALAHGGSLTINPQTGLVEAGFLSSFLPMLVGAGLSVASGGALTPLMAAGIMGGGTALATGSLQKGLMAGLGAYGGAGLAGGLVGVGAGAASTEAASTEAASRLTAQDAASTAAMEADANARNLLMNRVSSLPAPDSFANLKTGASSLMQPGGFDAFKDSMGGYRGMAKSGLAAMAPVIANGLAPASAAPVTPPSTGMIRPYTYNSIQNEPENPLGALYTPGQSTQERNYMTNTYTAGTPYAAPGAEYKSMAEGGVAKLDSYSYNPDTSTYAPSTLPSSSSNASLADTASLNSMEASAYTYNPVTQRYAKVVPEDIKQTASVAPVTNYSPDYADGGYINRMYAGGGGIANLGSYSDGGQLLRGPGDGVSDSIPAMIGQKQPARLADGEFVVPARIVSELGNGSTDAGARQLYAMMDRVQKARKKSVDKDKVAANTKASRLLPA